MLIATLLLAFHVLFMIFNFIVSFAYFTRRNPSFLTTWQAFLSAFLCSLPGPISTYTVLSKTCFPEYGMRIRLKESQKWLDKIAERSNPIGKEKKDYYDMWEDKTW